jgi:hypothetical protein
VDIWRSVLRTPRFLFYELRHDEARTRECGLAVVSVVERLDHSYNNIFTFDVEGRSLIRPTVADGIYFYPLFPLVGEKLLWTIISVFLPTRDMMFNAMTVLPDPVATSNKPPSPHPRGVCAGRLCIYVCFNYILIVSEGADERHGYRDRVRGFYSFLVFRIARRQNLGTYIFLFL